MNKILHLTVFFLIMSITGTLAQKHGNASYYSHKLEGRHTSDGGKYHRDSLTCAHRTLPFGTQLKIRNPKNDKEVIVTVTDRGPHVRKFMVDLSYRAAKELGIIRQGYAHVEIIELESTPSPLLTNNEDVTSLYNAR